MPNVSFLSYDSYGNFAVLIGSKRYEYKKVSPYLCDKLRWYIKYKNWRSFFSSLRNISTKEEKVGEDGKR